MPSTFTGATGELVRSLIFGIFVAAGTVMGTVGGLLSGIINKNGMMQGTVWGAITGGLVSLELAESLLSIWCCNDYSLKVRIRRTLLELQRLLLQGANFLRGGVFVTISSALEGQIEVLLGHSGRGEHRGDLFGLSDPVMPMPRDIFDSLPVMEITKETAGQQTTCTICLYELQDGESARRLPACCHVFHSACIHNWFMWKSDCPVCRHPAYT